MDLRLKMVSFASQNGIFCVSNEVTLRLKVRKFATQNKLPFCVAKKWDLRRKMQFFETQIKWVFVANIYFCDAKWTLLFWDAFWAGPLRPILSGNINLIDRRHNINSMNITLLFRRRWARNNSLEVPLTALLEFFQHFVSRKDGPPDPSIWTLQQDTSTTL